MNDASSGQPNHHSSVVAYPDSIGKLAPDNPLLHVHMFGRFRVINGQKALPSIGSSKAQELFCYLVLHRKQVHNREFLSHVLWDEMSASQSRKHLRHTLWQLQALLGTDKRTATELQNSPLLVDSNWVQFNEAAAVWVDVTIFEDAFNLLKGVAAKDIGRAEARMLEDAVQLFQGELLEGWYQDWCLQERDRLLNMRWLLIDKLMDHLTLKQEYASAIVYGEAVLRVERARESTHQRLMRLRYLAGDRVAALRQYHLCAAALHDDLGVQPARTTRELRSQIEADRMVADLPGAIPLMPLSEPAESLTQVLVRLRDLNAKLMEAQRQVERDLDVIERTLHGQRH